jgi:hypothetical protein
MREAAQEAERQAAEVAAQRVLELEREASGIIVPQARRRRVPADYTPREQVAEANAGAVAPAIESITAPEAESAEQE